MHESVDEGEEEEKKEEEEEEEQIDRFSEILTRDGSSTSNQLRFEGRHKVIQLHKISQQPYMLRRNHLHRSVQLKKVSLLI